MLVLKRALSDVLKLENWVERISRANVSNSHGHCKPPHSVHLEGPSPMTNVRPTLTLRHPSDPSAFSRLLDTVIVGTPSSSVELTQDYNGGAALFDDCSATGEK
jgi:hypothetical protein